MHLRAGIHVAVVGRNQVLVDHLDGMESQRIRVLAVHCGYIGLDGMGHGVHTRMGRQLLGHGFCQSRVNNRHIRRDVEVSQRVLYALVVVSDNGEGRHFRSRTGGRRNRAEFCLRTQSREAERCNQALKGCVRILIEYPHSLCGINGGTASDGDNPVGAKLSHGLGAFHNRVDRRIRLNAFKQFHVHAGFL